MSNPTEDAMVRTVTLCDRCAEATATARYMDRLLCAACYDDLTMDDTCDDLDEDWDDYLDEEYT